MDDDDYSDWEYGPAERMLLEEGLSLVEPSQYEESVEEAAAEVLSRLLDAAVALYASSQNISEADAWKEVLAKAEHNSAVS